MQTLRSNRLDAVLRRSDAFLLAVIVTSVSPTLPFLLPDPHPLH